MYYQRRANKFGAKKKEYNGRMYHSKMEAGYAATLELLKKSGEILEYTPQFKLSLDVNGHHVCNYYVDFMVVDKFGEKQLHEVKGFRTAVWELKWKLTEALYGKEYTLVLIS